MFRKLLSFATVLGTAFVLIGMQKPAQAQSNSYMAANAVIGASKKSTVCSILLRGEYVDEQTAGGIQITGKGWKFVGNLYLVECIPSEDGSIHAKMTLYGKYTAKNKMYLSQLNLQTTTNNNKVASVGFTILGARQDAGKTFFSTGPTADPMQELPVQSGFVTIKLE